MTLVRLPIPLQDAPDDPAAVAAADLLTFPAAPIVALYDAPAVARGALAAFRVEALDAPPGTVFTVRAWPLATAHTIVINPDAGEDQPPFRASDDGVTAVPGDRPAFVDFTFTDVGTIYQQTGGPATDDDEEFAFAITAVTPAYLVRARATGRIRSRRGALEYRVYAADVYADDVYQVLTN